MRNRSILLIVVVLMLTAALPRLYELGALGFYGDEETTALASRALAEGHGAQMPSGMPYYRALPQTWLNSLSASIFGLADEFSYRLPAAILGILTVPLLFLMARSFAGTPVALVAALLLALSEWHIATSREARMYAPFLLFYTAAALTTWRWTQTAKHRDLFFAAILFALSVTLHDIGVIGLIFVLLPLAFANVTQLSASRLFTIAGMGVFGTYLFTKYIINAPYRAWFPVRDVIAPVPFKTSLDLWLPKSIAILPYWAIAILALSGALAGFWIAVRSEPVETNPGRVFRKFIRFSAAASTGALALLGQVYGAVLAGIIFLLLHPGNKLWILNKTWVPVTIIAVAVAAWLATAIGMFGAAEGLKALIAFPFPYPAYLAELFPGAFVLFAGTTAWLALQAHKPEATMLRVFALAVILPLIAVGAMSKWGGIRYLIEVYPFLLLVAAAGLMKLLSAIGQWGKQYSTPIAVGLVMSGLLGGHGMVPAFKLATLSYGDTVDLLIFDNPIYPDHKTPGEFLHRNIIAGDRVIAEDPLQQRWYARQADFWLQNPAAAGHFAYRGPDGKARDIYVNSQLIIDEAMLRAVSHDTSGRVWLITSGETQAKRDYYLAPWQKTWLESLERTQSPMYTGLDGVTRVYCISCK